MPRQSILLPARRTRSLPIPCARFSSEFRCFDPCTNLVPVLPFSGLLDGIHSDPQAKLGSDLQTKVPDRFTGLAAFVAVVRSSYRAPIEHRARSTGVSVKDRMERTTGAVVAAQYAMVYGTITHGTSGRRTFPSRRRKGLCPRYRRRACCG